MRQRKKNYFNTKTPRSEGQCLLVFTHKGEGAHLTLWYQPACELHVGRRDPSPLTGHLVLDRATTLERDVWGFHFLCPRKNRETCALESWGHPIAMGTAGHAWALEDLTLTLRLDMVSFTKQSPHLYLLGACDVHSLPGRLAGLSHQLLPSAGFGDRQGAALLTFSPAALRWNGEETECCWVLEAKMLGWGPLGLREVKKPHGIRSGDPGDLFH